MDTIGSRVRSERERLGIDRTQLSKLTGVGYTTISELERGGMRTTTKLRLIANALGVSLEWLETGRGAKASSESHSVGLSNDMITDAVRIANHVRDAALEPMADETFVQVLAAALQLVSVRGDAGQDVPMAAREVAAKIRSRG